jgi:hypothetical protein
VTAAATPTNLLDLSLSAARERLAEYFARIDQPAYRTQQVLRRLWENPAPSFDAMTELPA